MTNQAEKVVLNTGPRRSTKLCHNNKQIPRKEATQSIAAPDTHQLDLLPLSNIRRVCVSLPPQLTARLDKQRGKLSRSYVIKISVQAFLDQLEKLREREKLLEASNY